MHSSEKDNPFLSRLISIVKPLMETKARKGDWSHIRRAVSYGQYLLEHEPGDPDIVIPALYLHDIGWTCINFQDFTDAVSPTKAEHTASEMLHMEQGAVFASEILTEMNYPFEKTKLIADIIAVHDLPEKIFALNNTSATLIMEADRLDRYGQESITRFEAVFGKDYLKGEAGKEWRVYLKNGLTQWFKTRTGRSKALELSAELGIV